MGWKGLGKIEPGILQRKAQSTDEILMCLQNVEFNLVSRQN